MPKADALRTSVPFPESARLRWWWAALALLTTVAPVFLPSAYVVQVTDILLFVLLAVSVNLLTGYGGMISLGHAAYFAIGGYTAGLLVVHLQISMPVALVAGPLAAALAALVIGFFCIRLSGAYFIMLTLAFGQLVYTIIWKWRELTRGDDGLIGISPPAVLLDPLTYYYFVLVVIVACLAVIYRICQSPFGATLKAIRDTPTRARSIGIDVQRFQLFAFVMAGLFAGIAGALFAFHHRSIFPQSSSWMTSAEITLMAVLGGTNYFTGPILGAVVLKSLGFAIPRVTPYWLFILGAIVLFVAFVMPTGMMDAIVRYRFRHEGGDRP